MVKMRLTTRFFAVLMIVISMQVNGQTTPTAKVDFLNAPVLFKEGGKSYQQVVASLPL